MNLLRHPQRFTSRLTSKYQATIPREVRNALGLKSGDLVSFILDEQGDAVLRRETDDVRQAERAQRLRAGVAEARRRFAAENTLPSGMTSEEWIEQMRGPPAEV
jgi:AbrB family looped-hinge helix DNA binding protein